MTSLKLGELRRHGYNNNHMVTVKGWIMLRGNCQEETVVEYNYVH